jgi:predicted metalloprotease with PDZ domain
MATGVAQAQSAAQISYSLAYTTAGADQVHISIDVPETVKTPLTMIMPRAIPMGYGEQYFDRYLDSVTAYSKTNEPLPAERLEGPRWSIGRNGSQVARVEYAVNLARMEREILSAADTSKIRAGYLGLLGYSVFAFIEGLESQPIRLQITGPTEWPIFSTLDPRLPMATREFAAEATNFYALADSQIAMGPQLKVQRLAGTVPLFVAIYSEGEVDIELEAKLSLEALERLIDYFGQAPFKYYTVHLELLRPVSPQHSYGFSMEHLDSSTYYLAADQGLTTKSNTEQRERVRFNRAHHIAHAWIPKRAYGEGYFPFNWELAPLIDTIWLSEGFARHIASEALSAGLPESQAKAYKQRQLELLRRIVTNAPAFIRRLSLVDLSRVGSTRYSEDFRVGRNLFARGALLAADLDELIGESSGGKKSLRDAMKQLMVWCQRAGRGFRINELAAIIKEGTGVDTRKVLDKWLQPLER